MATGDETQAESKTNDTDVVNIEVIKEDCEDCVVKTEVGVDETVSLRHTEALVKDKESMINFVKIDLDTAELKTREEASANVGVTVKTQADRVQLPLKSERERRVKVGHRRVRADGQVTYKNILTSRILDSIRLGIERSLTCPTSRSERDLLMQDFMTVESTPFSPTGLSGGLSRFVFKTYAPLAFRHFRELFGIRADDFLASFCEKRLKELSGSGKSGSIFYLTGDDRFIVKSMLSKESSFLQKLLPGYYMNLHQNPDTLLPKYFGLYCYQCDMKKIKLVAMNNILPSSIDINRKYDLKGATYKRRASGHDVNPTYKDLDFVQHHPTGLFLDNDIYNALIKTIKRDCTVLESFKIIDYSLLLGLSDVEAGTSLTGFRGLVSEQGGSTDRQPTPNRIKSFPSGGLPALDGEGKPVLIFVGIIDILQSYKLKKKLERAWKSVIHDGNTVSVHRPDFYSTRFQSFMVDNVFKRLPVPLAKRRTGKQLCFRTRERVLSSDNDPKNAT